MTEIEIESQLAGGPKNDPAGPIHPDFEGTQGDLVGFDNDGQLVHATAAPDGSGSEVDYAVPCRGVLFHTRIRDPANDPVAQAVDAARLHMEANDTIPGEHRGRAVYRGIRLHNYDEDWGFTCGQNVYLSESGGVTQTEPSTAGAIIQAIGWPESLDDIPAGESLWLEPDTGYDTVA